MSAGNRYRLVTRMDFDGLVSAILLKELDLIGEIVFVHPKDMQDGRVQVSKRDITTNLPYVDGVHLAFDHHLSEKIRISGRKPNHIIDADAPSAARVVFNYYGGTSKFPRVPDEMMAAVDKSDSAQFSMQEVLEPRGWVLLNFILDARTGLGRFEDLSLTTRDLMLKLMDCCLEKPIEEILAMPEVKERCALFFRHEEACKQQIRNAARVYKNLVILDLRESPLIYAGNRFLVYALFPDCNISIHVLWGLKKQNTVFAVGKSIFNRTSKTNIGALMLKYGGGGHANAGTCQVANEKAAHVLKELITTINADG